jgi:hypothetical protein
MDSEIEQTALNLIAGNTADFLTMTNPGYVPPKNTTMYPGTGSVDAGPVWTDTKAQTAIGDAFQTSVTNTIAAKYGADPSSWGKNDIIALTNATKYDKNIWADQMGVSTVELQKDIDTLAQVWKVQVKGYASGGISTGPSSGYLATLHGTEAVIPLSSGFIPVKIEGPSNDESAQEMKELKEDEYSMYHENVRSQFGYDNETIFAYKVKNNIRIFYCIF